MSKKKIKIRFHNVSFQYHTHHWILKQFSFTLEEGEHLLILGPNGSGKSTLLSLITSYLTPTYGQIERFWDQKRIDKAHFYRYYAWISPHIKPPQYLTTHELCRFWYREKGLSIPPDQLLGHLSLDRAKNMSLMALSSGMLQKLLLGLVLFSPVPLLLLDEPSTFMDKHNRNWFLQELAIRFQSHQIILATNDQEEIQFFQSHNSRFKVLTMKS